MAVNNSINTLNQAISIISGTGAISIGADAAAKTITLGNGTGATSLVLNCGTGALNIGTNSVGRTITIGNTTANSIVTISAAASGSSGAINIGTTAASGIFIGQQNTSSNGNSINIGNSNNTSSTSVNILGGSGGVSVQTTNSTNGSINIGTLSTVGTGSINIGIVGIRTITVGNVTGATALVLNSGTGGISYPSLEVTGTSATLAKGIFYIANNGSLVTLTLPATAAVGDLIRVTGYGAGGWSIAQNAGQQILSSTASTTSGTGGSLASGNRYDCVELQCTVTDTTFIVRSFSGTLSYT